MIKFGRGFEVVKPSCRKTKGEVKLPVRGSKRAMAYDFFANEEYVVEDGETAKIWTDVKAYMRHKEGLVLNIRSSMGGVFVLANTQGWIDSDYYENDKNDGNIGIFLTNVSGETQIIHKGDRIAQGMFTRYLVARNGNTNNTRKGGFGSTGK